MPYVYFPYTSAASVLVPMEDGAAIEVAAIGNQGMIGLAVFLGDATATEEVAVQISGVAGRIPASTFCTLVGESQPLKHLMYGYALAFLQDIARTAGCNRVHSVRQRCARRLLVARDLAGTAAYALTHETLANLLGVRRASVSEAAEALRQEGIIEYHRGRITVVDVGALEMAACEDYQLVKQGYARIAD